MEARPRRLLPSRQICARYGVSDMTLHRWSRNPDLGFPKFIYINGRKYADEGELEEFDRKRRELGRPPARPGQPRPEPEIVSPETTATEPS
jgi:hypothetical protein